MSSEVMRMVREEQGGLVLPSRTPQWPPRQAITPPRSFMARCAKAGGRQVAWPPRAEDLYSSQPSLHTSSSGPLAADRQVPASPRVPPAPAHNPLHPLHKAHSSAPNLFDPSLKPPRPGRPRPLHPNYRLSKEEIRCNQESLKTDREEFSDELSHQSSEDPSNILLESRTEKQILTPVMASSVNTNTNQVRVNQSSSQTYHFQQPQQKQVITTSTTRVVQNQFGGEPAGINIPVQFSSSPQQHVLQQQISSQQSFPKPFTSLQQFPDAQREFNVPIQMSDTPPANITNQPSLQAQGPYTLNSPCFASQGKTSVPTQPINTGSQFGNNSAASKVPMKFEGPPSAGAKEWPPQQTPDQPNLTTVYPSTFKLRDEMPVQQEGVPVVTSQPAFKMTKPMKMRGDKKWPPASSQEIPQQEVREFITPKKQTKDYSSFFAKHALPSNYTGYRAPPGTQHVGEGETDM